MLEFLDTILTWLFYYMPGFIFGIVSVIFMIIGISYLLNIRRGISNLTMAAACLTVSGMCYGFFPIRASVVESTDRDSIIYTHEIENENGDIEYIPYSEEDFGVLDNVMAMLITAVLAAIVGFLASIPGVGLIMPFIVWGVILFGW